MVSHSYGQVRVNEVERNIGWEGFGDTARIFCTVKLWSKVIETSYFDGVLKHEKGM